MDIQPSDEIITTPFTFVSTAETIASMKAKSVFVDIESDTFNIDANLIEGSTLVIPIAKSGKRIIPLTPKALSLIKNATEHVNRYLSNTVNVSETLASILNSY